MSLKQLGEHLSNYANLYIKPIDAWRKAVELRSDSYDFIVLHLVYFTVLIILNVESTYSAIQLALIEVVLTIFPLVIFIVPYRISSLLFNFPFKWISLFRLLLIIKFQFTPLFYVLLKLAEYSGSEFIYLIFDNSIFLAWICFIISFPLISSLKHWQKGVLLLLNYIAFSAFIFGFVFFFSELDFSGKLGKDMALISPSHEYSYNNSKLSQSRIYIEQKYYMLIGVEKDPGLITYIQTQFVDLRLHDLCIKKIINDGLRENIKFDSIICASDNRKISRKDSLQSRLHKKEITTKILDSFRDVNLSDLKKDIKLCDSLAKHSKFKSNREYSQRLLLHLEDYGESYFNNDEINNVYAEAKEKTILNVEKDVYITLLKIDSTRYDKTRIPYEQIKAKLDKREVNANLLVAVWFYPFDRILDLSGYYD